MAIPQEILDDFSKILETEADSWVQVVVKDISKGKTQQTETTPQKKFKRFFTKALSWLDNNRGGALVPPPQQGLKKRKPLSLLRSIKLQAPRVKESHFAVCDRIPAGQDNAGACLPGQGTPKKTEEQPKQGRELNSLFDRIRQPDGGFTYHVLSEEQPSEGFALSPYPDRSFAKEVKDLSLTDLAEYIVKNRDILSNQDHYLGAWHDPASGKVFLDVSVVSKDEEKAKKLALEKDQIAYFDLKKGVSVTVNPEALSGGAAKNIGVKDYARKNINRKTKTVSTGGRNQNRTDHNSIQTSDGKGADSGGNSTSQGNNGTKER